MLIVRIVFEIWKSNRCGRKKERITGNKKNIKVKNKKSHHYMMTFNHHYMMTFNHLYMMTFNHHYMMILTTVKTSQLKSTALNVKLTITNWAEIPPNSDSAVAVFNIIFKRVLRTNSNKFNVTIMHKVWQFPFLNTSWKSGLFT